MSYYIKFITVALAIIAFTLAGCSIITIYPQPTPGFTARVDYPVSHDKAWERVVEVLAIERVGTVYQSKDKGRLITGFFTGAKGGSEMQDKARWSYVITFAQRDKNTTRILIESKVEQVLKGWGYTYSWRDVTNHPGVKKGVADGLDKWLYEKIEAQLRMPRQVS